MAEEDADSGFDAFDAPLGALGSQVQGSEEDDADAVLALLDSPFGMPPAPPPQVPAEIKVQFKAAHHTNASKAFFYNTGKGTLNFLEVAVTMPPNTTDMGALLNSVTVMHDGTESESFSFFF